MKSRLAVLALGSGLVMGTMQSATHHEVANAQVVASGVFDGLYWGNFEYSIFAPRRSGCPGDGDWYLFRNQGSDFETQFRALYPNYDDYPFGVEGGLVWVKLQGTVYGPTKSLPWGHEYGIRVGRVFGMIALDECQIELQSVYLPLVLPRCVARSTRMPDPLSDEATTRDGFQYVACQPQGGDHVHPPVPYPPLRHCRSSRPRSP